MNTTKSVLAHLLEGLVDRMPELDAFDEAQYRDEKADYDGPGHQDYEEDEDDAEADA